MKSVYLFCALLVVTIAAVSSLSIESPSPESKIQRYYGYQVFRARPETTDQAKALLSLYTGDPLLDFWRVGHELGDFSDVMVAPEKNGFFQDFLKINEIPYDIHIADVERLVEEERRVNDAARKGKTSSRTINWDDYQRLDSINGWMAELAVSYPNLVQVEDIGTTYEGRSIKSLSISTDRSANKPTIVVDGGIHAREWITPAFVTYLINEFVTKPETYADILAKFDICCIPVLNPDGYDYTWTSRYWRKNRQQNPGSGCRGVDLNRNFAFKWATVGSSTDPCSETYHGLSGGSEKESQALESKINGLQTTGHPTPIYLTFHSYGQYLLTPWGYTTTYPDDYYTHLEPAAIAARDAILAYGAGTTYTIGTSTNALYAAAGGSDDFAKGQYGCKYSYCIELRDEGAYGFNLPASQIKPCSEETMLGVAALIRKTMTLPA